MRSTILLIGLGDLGGILLELLLREGATRRIVVASRRSAPGEARCNLARLGALSAGHEPDLSFLHLDLRDRTAVADAVRRERPDIIISTACMLTWWMPGLLPPEGAEPLRRAAFGAWLPVHLSPTLRLMGALRMAEYGGLTVTAPFPDVVNCVLGKLGLAPTCGMGNLDEIVPKIRWLAARRLGSHPSALQVYLVAHHALERFALWGAAGDPPPYYLRVEHDGRDVTEEVNAAELLLQPVPITAGRATHFLTAGSAVRLIGALESDDTTSLHAPGPNGLPGGYPVVADRTGVRVGPLPGLALAEAIALNERSHTFDGIERIEDDGTVVMAADAATALRDVLGYDCERLAPAEVDDRAEELVARFSAYARRWGHGADGSPGGEGAQER